MSRRFLMRGAMLGAAFAASSAAMAQVWVPGSEIAGQTIQVQTNGIINNIYLSPDGTASISTPSGATVPGTWSAANNMLCLQARGVQECFPYTRPFQAGQQVALTSDCQQVSTILAQSTNPPVQQSVGERG